MVSSVQTINCVVMQVHVHGEGNMLKTISYQLKSNFNYKLEHKRVLKFDNIVSDEDNIRQNIVDATDKKTADEQKQTDAEEEVKFLHPVYSKPDFISTKVEDEEDEDDLESFLAA